MIKKTIKKVAVFTAIVVAVSMSPIGTIQAQNNLSSSSTPTQGAVQIVDAKKLNSTCIEIVFSNQEKMLLDFYGDNIFRMFQDNSGKGMRDPQAKPEAKILLDNPKKPVAKLELTSNQGYSGCF